MVPKAVDGTPAARINHLGAERGEAWPARPGGLISSEREIAKGLPSFEEDCELYDEMAGWVEAADSIVWQPYGCLVRNAAGEPAA
jgi:L-ribulokinase